MWVVLVIVALDGLYTGYMSETRIFNRLQEASHPIGFLSEFSYSGFPSSAISGPAVYSDFKHCPEKRLIGKAFKVETRFSS